MAARTVRRSWAHSPALPPIGRPWTPADVQRSIPAAFAEQVRARPGKQAVVGGAATVTYAELDAAANRNARRVTELCGPQPCRVALLAADDAPLVAAVVGVFKAGKSVVVLNCADPPERLRQIIDDAQPALLLTDADHAGLAIAAGVREHSLGSIADLRDGGDPGAPAVAIDPHAPACLMYTSGSTGRPKGVIHTQRTLMYHTARLTNSYGYDDRERIPALVSVSALGGISPVLGALLNGATLCVFVVAERGLAGFGRWAAEQRLTVLSTFPSLFRHLVPALEGVGLDSVRRAVLFGEPVLAADHRACRRLFGPACPFASALGLTETGLITRHWVTGDELPDGPLPVGRPMDWVELRVLDDHGRPVAAGATGEIAVDATSSSPGYWHDGDLTAARFVEGEQGRMFLTGDLGRITPDGVLWHLGRRDEQVKVRGNRISINEVEAAISALRGVTGAVVCPTEGPRADTVLTAYVSADAAAKLTATGVREALRRSLPEREIPTAFVFVEAFPFTPRGKVDRARLMALHPPVAPTGDGEIPAVAETEDVLGAIWCRAFGLEHVGVDDDFFALAGDSLTAAAIGADVHGTFGVRLDLAAIVDHPTVRGLAALIERRRAQEVGADDPPIARAPRDRALPMSFSQERTWRNSQTPEQAAAFLEATSLRICGPLDVDALERSLGSIIRRHEILRTTFELRDGAPVQVVHPAAPFSLPLVEIAPGPDSDERSFAELARVASAPFDLRRGLLLRLQLVRAAPEEHHLHWAAHHIISDGWSWRVFLDELRALYEAQAGGHAEPLPAAPALQYGDFAAWERRWLEPGAPAFDAEMDWWRERLRGAPAPAPTPLPFARSASAPDARAEDGVLLWGLDPAVTRGLDRLGREGAATFYMTRLTVFAAQLMLDTGDRDLVLGTYASGRARPETHAMLGFFSNLVTLRLPCAPEQSFRELLREVRGCVVATSPHTSFPYELLVESLAAEGAAPPPVQAIYNPGGRSTLRLGDLELSPMPGALGGMPWGFSFAPSQTHEDRGCAAVFDPRVHDPAAVTAFIERYRRLAGVVCAEPDRPLERLAGPR